MAKPVLTGWQSEEGWQQGLTAKSSVFVIVSFRYVGSSAFEIVCVLLLPVELQMPTF